MKTPIAKPCFASTLFSSNHFISDKNSNDPPIVEATLVDESTMPTTTAYDDTEAPTEPSVNYDATPSQQLPQVKMVYGHLGRRSQHLQCPFCQQVVVTRTRDRIDGITIVFVIVLCILFWPLFWLPFCMPKCKSVHHYCPRCQTKVGVTDPCS